MGRSGYENYSEFTVATCSLRHDFKYITKVQVPLELKVIECYAINEKLLASSLQGYLKCFWSFSVFNYGYFLTCNHLPQKLNASNGRGDNILYLIFMTNHSLHFHASNEYTSGKQVVASASFHYLHCKK